MRLETSLGLFAKIFELLILKVGRIQFYLAMCMMRKEQRICKEKVWVPGEKLTTVRCCFLAGFYDGKKKTLRDKTDHVT